MLAYQFPSNVYCWRNLAEKKRLNIRTVPRPSDGNWTPGVLEEIGQDTAIVALPHVHWTDGTPVDLLAIREACDRVGSALVLDVSQSLGVIDLDVSQIRPDFLVSVGYKWLQGPYSVAYLYVSEAMREGEPLEHNWMNRRGSENVTKLVEYQSYFRAGARRFDAGEHSNLCLLPMAIAALEQVLAWGPAEISSYLEPLTSLVAKGAQELGLHVYPNRSPHFLGIRLPQSTALDLPAVLQKDRIFVSVRGDCVRVSPYVYNDEKDVLRFLVSLSEYLKIK